MCSLDYLDDDVVVDFVGGPNPRILRKGMVADSTVCVCVCVCVCVHMRVCVIICMYGYNMLLWRDGVGLVVSIGIISHGLYSILWFTVALL